MPGGVLRGGARLAAAACCLAALAALVVLRVGSEKLVPSPSARRARASHGTWRHMFALDGVGAAIPLPLWVVAVVAAGLIGLPYAWVCARSLPDRGYGLSRVVGLLLV